MKNAAADDEGDVTIVSVKGQVVIPQSLRTKLGIKPGTRLVVYGYKDVVIMKKLDIADVVRDLKSVYQKVDARAAKHGRISEHAITSLVKKHRNK